MVKEIDKDYYCSGNFFIPNSGVCKYRADHCNIMNGCLLKHRKWPTLEQFLEEYGEEYTTERPVWLWVGYEGIGGWEIKTFYEAKKRIKDIKEINGWTYSLVCACTPWGKPPDDWRP